MIQARRQYLQTLLKQSKVPRSIDDQPCRMSKHRKSGRMPLKVLPGYTALVVDTNILLSSFSEFSVLVESCRWTVVVPLAVITELDGISSNENELGAVASAAVAFIGTHLRSHSISLKVQTSKGNYLSTLNVRSEDFSFALGEGSWERNMDDLIIRAAVWQRNHWVDRSRLLNQSSQTDCDKTTSKVVLLSFDRNR
jgi:protein SMG6